MADYSKKGKKIIVWQEVKNWKKIAEDLPETYGIAFIGFITF